MSEAKTCLDLIIVGAGPAGLSSAEAAKREGLNYLVIEKSVIASTVHQYPLGRVVFSTPNELEFHAGDLKPIREKPTREELLSYYVHFVLDNDLCINTDEEVTRIEVLEDGTFHVMTSRGVYESRFVLVCSGGMAIPRRLGVPGEDLPKVFHRFSEPYAFIRRDVLVVGGGNSAAEAALFLAEEGARTTLAIWRSDWENRDPAKGAMKHWVREPLEREIELGRLRVILFEGIEEISEREVRIRTERGDGITILNDAVFILVGADADLTLLREVGVETVPSGFTQIPVYDPETFETNIRGLFVAGHFTHARHIKKAIDVPRTIVPMIAKRQGKCGTGL